MTLLETIRQGLLVSASRNTDAVLGNRSEYAGLTDLARYFECPRAAIAAKICEQENSLGDIITLQRGHWFEAGIAEAFATLEANPIQQLEISVNEAGAPLKAHLDFTLVWGKPFPAIRIVEVKSTEKLPDNPRDSHRFQAQSQVCLLARYWNEPVFSIRNKDGHPKFSNLNFPEICYRQLGIDLPLTVEHVSLECWLLYLSMRNAKAFGPYVNLNGFMDQITGIARSFWDAKSECASNPAALKQIDYAKGFYPLCVHCGAALDCPKFTDNAVLPQWEPALAKLESLKIQKADTEQAIKEIEDALKQVYRQASTSDWLMTGKHRFRLSETKGRQTLDTALLKEELDCLFENYDIQDSAEAMLQRCSKIGASYERLAVNPLK